MILAEGVSKSAWAFISDAGKIGGAHKAAHNITPAQAATGHGFLTSGER